MSEERILKNQGDEDRHDLSDKEVESGVTRRDFIQKTMAVAAGLALTQMLPPFATEAQAAGAQATTTCPGAGLPLQKVMELVRSDETKTLEAVVKVLNENKTYLAASVQGSTPVCNSGQMRFFTGYDPRIKDAPVWPGPALKGTPTPGPTFRARVGDTVQITLLNQVDVSAFGDSLDAAEKGKGCDTAISVGPGGGSGVNTYPGVPPFDIIPDCFHGSSSTNLHFHGTHVSPNSIADNVLVTVRPSPIVNGKPMVDEEFVKAEFAKVFDGCKQGHMPMKWAEWPEEWQTKQKELLVNYDKTAAWQGGNGLPPKEQLWLKNEKAIANGTLPQYYIGGYPTCLQFPTGENTIMGQAPGTHWYHAHKHGSTALNLANGLAGAFIIEGPYDDGLEKFYTKQHVLVLQQYGSQVNLMRNPALGPKNTTTDLVFVNAQMTPVIEMKPNEMQFWRIINACHQKGVPINAPPNGIKWVQTAQDGVQFTPVNPVDSTKPGNYNPAITNASFPIPASQTAPFGSMSPGNRIDLLVQAPSAPGTFSITFGGKNVLLFTVKVIDDKSIANPMPFPTPAQFPAMPAFLADLNPADVVVRRELHFRSTGAGNPNPPAPSQRGKNAPFPPPSHTINGKKFEDHIIDQSMLLGATEEWTLYNDTGGAAHPFHIHINPFQVIEILNPSVSATPVKLPRPWVWWDDFAIPPAAVPPGSPAGTAPVSGHVKFLSKFVDFTGMYVLHCHILGHEDRGMMQLVQVISNTTDMDHH